MTSFVDEYYQVKDVRASISCFEVDAAEEPQYWHGFEPRVWSEEEGWHNDPSLYEPEKIDVPRCECGGELEPYSWYEPSWMCKGCGKEYNEEALKTQPTQMRLTAVPLYRRGDRVRLLKEPDKTGTIDGRNGGYYMVEWDNGTYTALYPTMIEPEGGEQLKLAAPRPLEGQQELEVPSTFRWITYYGPDATDLGVRSFATREEAEAEVERMKANGWAQALTLPRGFTHDGIPIRTGARPGEGQMDLGIPNYVYRYIVMHGDWYTGVFLHEEDAERQAEQDRAQGIDAKVVCQCYDEQGAPRDACPKCGHMMLKGGVCAKCNYNPRFAAGWSPRPPLAGSPRQKGQNSDNPFGVTEDFSHTVPDAEWNIVRWDKGGTRDGWFIEVNAPGMEPVGGWGPFPSYEAAEKYVMNNTVLGQKPLLNYRDMLPGSMADSLGE